MRLIDADALKEYFRNHVIIDSDGKRCYYGKFLESIIDEQPTVEAEPIRYGRWITVNVMNVVALKCSECLHYTNIVMSNYCPGCGARMNGGAENG